MKSSNLLPILAALAAAAPAHAGSFYQEPPQSLESKLAQLLGTRSPARPRQLRIPEPKPGHIYRLRVQTGQGVGAGDGFKIYINGKSLVEATAGLGRGEGENIRGGWITPEFLEEFGGGPVTLAATSFLRYGDRAIIQMPPVPQGIFSMWLEERKLPPLGE